MKHVIKIKTLSTQLVNTLQREIDRYQKNLPRKIEDFMNRVKEFGLTELASRLSEAGEGTVTIYATETVEEGVDRVSLVAQGETICFLEFGTGVHYNGLESYPDPSVRGRVGVVGIGQYGNGYGQRQAWGYYGDPDKWTIKQVVLKGGETVNITYGIPTQHFMWDTARILEDNIERIARETFI